MCVRGLLMMMHLEYFENPDMFDVTLTLVETLYKVLEDLAEDRELPLEE